MSISGNDLRRAFLEYWRDMPGAAHKVVESAPIIPPDDPTLMFTSAGMVQFKRLYSGEIEPLPYSRATSSQKCLRAGGKGSDLENVGKTLRHHTFFEMLGHFSFGDYFKREAVRWNWKFVTEFMKLPKDRLFPTIFESDDEAEAIWREETDCPNLPPVRLDKKANFWGPAGDTGACGPCSEILFFMGTPEELREVREARAKSEDAYMPTLIKRIDEEGDLFFEIANMVFPQFDQQRDGSRKPLKYRGIDMGAGLERMTTAMLFSQGLASTPYETDLLWPIVQRAAELLNVKYFKVLDEGGKSPEAAKQRLAINAISDHARALSFSLAEGITPGNIGRGYVIRRIQRRALRFASLLGMDHPFMADLVDPVIEAMGGAYPELKPKADFIKKSLRIEEESFLRTRNRGIKLLDDLIAQAKNAPKHVIPGPEAFKLWDTYGFPVDLTREIAEDQGVHVDTDGFDKSMREQKEKGRASWQGEDLDKAAQAAETVAAQHGVTKFLGYGADLQPEEAKVLAIVVDGATVNELQAGMKADLVLDCTPFYAESGGQVGDTGSIVKGLDATFEVFDTQKTPSGVYLHRGELESGMLHVGDVVSARVDVARRMAIKRNHSTTHLLQAALKKHVGAHVTQAGSYVGPEYMRFDFSQPEAIPAETLRLIQEDVNRMILADLPVHTEVMALEEARKRGAIAPFGEKYGPTVRVVQMGAEGHTASLEFCGGTHLERTGQAARFRLVSEGSISSGVRRIEGVTGERAAELEIEEQYDVLGPLQSALAVKGRAVVDRVEQLSQRVRALEKELAKERQKGAVANIDKHIADAKSVGDCKVATAIVDGLEANELRTLATSLREKLGSKGIAIAVSKTGDKVSLVVAVGADAQAKYPAGKVVNAIATPLGGKGGGKPDIAQAGAKDAGNVEEIVSKAAELIGAL